jgi:hypothetical protein
MKRKAKRRTKYGWIPPQKKRPFGYYAIVHLDGASVKADFVNRHLKIKNLFEKTQEEWQKHCTVERPEYERWQHLTFGALEQEHREFEAAAVRLETLLDNAEKYAFIAGIKLPEAFVHIETHLSGGGSIEELFEPFGDEFEEDYAEFEEEDVLDEEDYNDDDSWSNFGKTLEEFIRQMHESFGDDNYADSGLKKHHDSPGKTHEKNQLRAIYRKLCKRLHPDTGCEFDDNTREIWHTIQNAYETGDLERLEAIQARMDLQNDISKGTISCSNILAVIKEFELGIKSVKSLIARAKRQKVWGFLKWDEKKRQKHKTTITLEKQLAISYLKGKIKEYELTFERWRKQHKQAAHNNSAAKFAGASSAPRNKTKKTAVADDSEKQMCFDF